VSGTGHVPSRSGRGSMIGATRRCTAGCWEC